MGTYFCRIYGQLKEYRRGYKGSSHLVRDPYPLSGDLGHRDRDHCTDPEKDQEAHEADPGGGTEKIRRRGSKNAEDFAEHGREYSREYGSHTKQQ